MENNNASSSREKIAERLKEARISSGLSQAQAATQLKLQRPAISEIEAGNRKVSAEEVIQFANLYKVDSNWLLLQDSQEETEQFKLAARELEKLSEEDLKKVMDILKILPKKR
ncbi:helix-turn-helix domain-containing protein [Flavobacterium sp. N1736]|uniref:helix-turn-helix domain-containing protein n=1 Tax=Flavobacterium sp. N1736 TaxID=2986823 RepID=UPI00222451A6|nr:helix-turn-helix transcriptional regulator [Flavobacterium sp. N1736]